MCRKALELHNQDLAKAEKWLRAEAIKQGWEKAERVKVRINVNIQNINRFFIILESKHG